VSKIIPLTKGKFAIVDDVDYDWLTGIRPESISTATQRKPRQQPPMYYHWYWIKSNGAAGTSWGCGVNKKHFLMHRLIMNAPDDMEVDHINHNKLDNRRENLRLATRMQNAHNMIKPKHGTTSLYIGVIWSKKYNTWVSQIAGIEGVKYNKFLGHYDNELIAAIAYDYAARERDSIFFKGNFTDEEFGLLWKQYGEQIINRKIAKGPKNKNSKYVGVIKDNRDNTWNAHAVIKGKRIYVGRFKDEESCHQAQIAFVNQQSLEKTNETL
jgi:HNH endonuclease